MRVIRVTPVFGAFALLAILVSFFLYLIMQLKQIDPGQSDIDGKSMSACFEKYKVTLSGTKAATVVELLDMNGFCYSTLGSQLKIDEEKILRGLSCTRFC